jgi:hypothetical protein
MHQFVKRLPWCDLYVDAEHGVVLQQWWKYNWQQATIGGPDWTLAEKKRFHRSVRRQVALVWNNRVRLRLHVKSDPHSSLGHAEGPSHGSLVSSFVSRFGSSGAPINMDIRWVLSGGHWDVTVWKTTMDLQTSVGHVDSCSIDGRKIVLHATSTKPQTACVYMDWQGKRDVCLKNHLVIPHEFGHSLQNWDDEYETFGRSTPGLNPYYADVQSIMSLGRQLRARHFKSVVRELNTMVPGVTFSVLSISNPAPSPRVLGAVQVDPVEQWWQYNPNVA